MPVSELPPPLGLTAVEALAEAPTHVKSEHPKGYVELAGLGELVPGIVVVAGVVGFEAI